MSKNHRGSGIRSLPNHGRGTCAICGKTDIKVLYEKEINVCWLTLTDTGKLSTDALNIENY